MTEIAPAHSDGDFLVPGWLQRLAAIGWRLLAAIALGLVLLGIATMLISHDISIISRLSDAVAVMYGGTVVETGPARDVLAKDKDIKHPYTSALLTSIPSAENIKGKGHLQAIEGDVLDTINIPAGCRFYGRCSRVTDKIRERCERQEPDLREIGPGHKARCWLYFE